MSRMGAADSLMSETVPVELADELSRRPRTLAAAANRPLEDAVVDWIRQAVLEWEVESVPDDELLRLCDATLAAAEQEELSNRLAEAREGRLDAAGRAPRCSDGLAAARTGAQGPRLEPGRGPRSATAADRPGCGHRSCLVNGFSSMSSAGCGRPRATVAVITPAGRLRLWDGSPEPSGRGWRPVPREDLSCPGNLLTTALTLPTRRRCSMPSPVEARRR